MSITFRVVRVDTPECWADTEGLLVDLAKSFSGSASLPLQDGTQKTPYRPKHLYVNNGVYYAKVSSHSFVALSDIRQFLEQCLTQLTETGELKDLDIASYGTSTKGDPPEGHSHYTLYPVRRSTRVQQQPRTSSAVEHILDWISSGKRPKSRLDPYNRFSDAITYVKASQNSFDNLCAKVREKYPKVKTLSFQPLPETPSENMKLRLVWPLGNSEEDAEYVFYQEITTSCEFKDNPSFEGQKFGKVLQELDPDNLKEKAKVRCWPRKEKKTTFSIMGISAKDCATQVMESTGDLNFEWLHRHAHSLGGKDVASNLVCGTTSANTFMIVYESIAREYFFQGKKPEIKTEIKKFGYPRELDYDVLYDQNSSLGGITFNLYEHTAPSIALHAAILYLLGVEEEEDQQPPQVEVEEEKEQESKGQKRQRPPPVGEEEKEQETEQEIEQPREAKGPRTETQNSLYTVESSQADPLSPLVEHIPNPFYARSRQTDAYNWKIHSIMSLQEKDEAAERKAITNDKLATLLGLPTKSILSLSPMTKEEMEEYYKESVALDPLSTSIFHDPSKFPLDPDENILVGKVELHGMTFTLRSWLHYVKPHEDNIAHLSALFLDESSSMEALLPLGPFTKPRLVAFKGIDGTAQSLRIGAELNLDSIFSFLLGTASHRKVFVSGDFGTGCNFNFHPASPTTLYCKWDEQLKLADWCTFESIQFFVNVIYHLDLVRSNTERVIVPRFEARATFSFSENPFPVTVYGGKASEEHYFFGFEVSKWQEPFGLKDLVLSTVSASYHSQQSSLEINACLLICDGRKEIKFDGTWSKANGLYLSASVSKLKESDLVSLHQVATGGAPVVLDKTTFELTDIVVSLRTHGEKAGFWIAAKMKIQDSEVAVELNVSRAGIKFSGKIDKVHLGGLNLEQVNLAMELSSTATDHSKIVGTTTFQDDFFGSEVTLLAQLGTPMCGIAMLSDTSLGSKLCPDLELVFPELGISYASEETAINFKGTTRTLPPGNGVFGSLKIPMANKLFGTDFTVAFTGNIEGGKLQKLKLSSAQTLSSLHFSRLNQSTTSPLDIEITGGALNLKFHTTLHLWEKEITLAAGFSLEGKKLSLFGECGSETGIEIFPKLKVTKFGMSVEILPTPGVLSLGAEGILMDKTRVKGQIVVAEEPSLDSLFIDVGEFSTKDLLGLLPSIVGIDLPKIPMMDKIVIKHVTFCKAGRDGMFVPGFDYFPAGIFFDCKMSIFDAETHCRIVVSKSMIDIDTSLPALNILGLELKSFDGKGGPSFKLKLTKEQEFEMKLDASIKFLMITSRASISIDRFGLKAMFRYHIFGIEADFEITEEKKNLKVSFELNKEQKTEARDGVIQLVKDAAKKMASEAKEVQKDSNAAVELYEKGLLELQKALAGAEKAVDEYVKQAGESLKTESGLIETEIDTAQNALKEVEDAVKMESRINEMEKLVQVEQQVVQELECQIKQEKEKRDTQIRDAENNFNSRLNEAKRKVENAASAVNRAAAECKTIKDHPPKGKNCSKDVAEWKRKINLAEEGVRGAKYKLQSMEKQLDRTKLDFKAEIEGLRAAANPAIAGIENQHQERAHNLERIKNDLELITTLEKEMPEFVNLKRDVDLLDRRRAHWERKKNLVSMLFDSQLKVAINNQESAKENLASLQKSLADLELQDTLPPDALVPIQNALRPILAHTSKVIELLQRVHDELPEPAALSPNLIAAMGDAVRISRESLQDTFFVEQTAALNKIIELNKKVESADNTVSFLKKKLEDAISCQFMQPIQVGTHETSTLGETHKISFLHPFKEPPRIFVGWNHLDIDLAIASLCVDVTDSQRDSFSVTYKADGNGETKFTKLGISWLAFPPSLGMTGTIDFGEMHGVTKLKKQISFDGRFNSSPKVLVSLASVNHNSHNTRMELAVEDLTKDGCTISAKTWWDSSNTRVKVKWVALSPEDAGITIGSCISSNYPKVLSTDTQILCIPNEKALPLKPVAFINLLDIQTTPDQKKTLNTRVDVTMECMNATEVRLVAKSWEDSCTFGFQSNWIAVAGEAEAFYLGLPVSAPLLKKAVACLDFWMYESFLFDLQGLLSDVLQTNHLREEQRELLTSYQSSTWETDSKGAAKMYAGKSLARMKRISSQMKKIPYMTTHEKAAENLPPNDALHDSKELEGKNGDSALQRCLLLGCIAKAFLAIRSGRKMEDILKAHQHLSSALERIEIKHGHKMELQASLPLLEGSLRRAEELVTQLTQRKQDALSEIERELSLVNEELKKKNDRLEELQVDEKKIEEALKDIIWNDEHLKSSVELEKELLGQFQDVMHSHIDEMTGVPPGAMVDEVERAKLMLEKWKSGELAKHAQAATKDMQIAADAAKQAAKILEESAKHQAFSFTRIAAWAKFSHDADIEFHFEFSVDCHLDIKKIIEEAFKRLWEEIKKLF